MAALHAHCRDSGVARVFMPSSRAACSPHKLQSRFLRNPFFYYPANHDPCFLEIHFNRRLFFSPMAMCIVRRFAEGPQVFLGDPSTFPDQPVCLLILPEISADHLKDFKQPEKVRRARHVTQHFFDALVA
jgi:hypothetical protein